MADTYRTLERPARVELRVRNSRFIAEAMPATSPSAAAAHIERIREQKYRADHHCMAYRVGPAGQTFRYDDDGEPSGTAGPPILRQIDAHDLTNTLVVVTRYFGGTKLGTGGLVRAYGDAAAAVLGAARIVEHVERESIRLQFAYDDTNPAQHVLRQFDTEVLDETYSDVTELRVGVRRSVADQFVEAFTNALGGRGEVVRENE
jgi:uncharacterized YigZ family protein